MECKKYNPFVVNKTRPKPKTKTRVEGKGLTNANEKKVDIIYAKGFVKLNQGKTSVLGSPTCFACKSSEDYNYINYSISFSFSIRHN